MSQKRAIKLGPEKEHLDKLASALFSYHEKDSRGFQNVPRKVRDYYRALAATAEGYGNPTRKFQLV